MHVQEKANSRIELLSEYTGMTSGVRVSLLGSTSLLIGCFESYTLNCIPKLQNLILNAECKILANTVTWSLICH